ncbi:hypothetical protein C5S25_06575 [Clostridium perfringens]|uniref:hypothetical protein n=1 Tax=Clostridium perfringens TaxID=1502 RepID=UPI001CCA0A38|nr:hypothetical protein [Clostridium perfringens]MDM0496815.1 hypothetical protein [Clostridium perfringens]UBK59202.1 hypothetical protein KLF43_05290 [Clostridium perfringens]
MENNFEVKSFLGMEVRVINREWVVAKDVFGVLGRLNSRNQISTGDLKKLLDFLELVDKKVDYQKLTIDFKKKGRGNKANGSIQKVSCIKLETLPLVLTQFKPINSDKRSTEENEAVKLKWAEFMKFVNKLLVENEAFKFVVSDVDLEKEYRYKLKSYGGNPVILASMTSYAMGIILTGDKVKITKEDLKSYKDKTTIDLIECRRFFIEEFVRAYRITKRHKEANRIALEYTLENYGLQERLLEVA